MSDRLKPLIQRAVLDIVEYDYQTRTEMVQLDRRISSLDISLIPL